MVETALRAGGGFFNLTQVTQKNLTRLLMLAFVFPYIVPFKIHLSETEDYTFSFHLQNTCIYIPISQYSFLTSLIIYFMKKISFILGLFLLFSVNGFSQSLRKCGCKSWRQWNSSIPKSKGESRWKRKYLYDKYLNACIIDCRKRK